ncbi:thioredoxin family protein [Pseudomonas fluorescens]|uniref:thioredoxin family protein n=1 Tax=Pseudomonas fluorescens TaxID=294 RepID=UPI00177C149B|nr:thioredoxin family protein [Pseudomonas fluorescens]MBD8193807.1 thioredoxin family protein [Pseudomonas fluorescens]MBD8228648.1 thioredoxin family protein [Pseudomonas fluorescens]MBD8786619.1 thioredoxin family protein [Pseudomonas fluorescens]MBD8818627.1 thioredoxin family protein [Pseudomonas fluorescens]
MSRIVELSAPQFPRFVAKGSSVVLFSASWCKPCKEMKPVFVDLEAKLHALAVFGKIDIAVSPTIAQMYGIRTVPSLAVFHEGRLLKVFAGSKSVSALKKAIVTELEDAS